jgi:oxygen-independent coproporphyrinogen-3 oxidase
VAGLYVHIPFCKKRCLYCDFYSTTLLSRREAYVNAVIEEIKRRKNELEEPIRTIYLGGGTPSTLGAKEIAAIINAIGTTDADEITMELNPGDASPMYLEALHNAGINRLSIGIQSFQDELLKKIGRRHTAAEAIEAVHMAKKAGFENISIDLMYALPGQTMEQWKADIETAIGLNVQHLSSYGLMYEEGTALTQMRDRGEVQETDEEVENAMYDYLCERLKEAGFVHYEVSNFALPEYEAKHNSSYWNGTPYVGIGAGAHSYIKNVRSWNPNDLDEYIRGIKNDTLVRESERLSEKDLYNEKVMLGLRTSNGCRLSPSVDRRLTVGKLSKKGLIRIENDGRIVATQEGLHVLNRIIEELMI